MRSSLLPALLVGRRRALLAALVGLGLVQAVLAVLTAFLTPRLFTAGGADPALPWILVAAAGLLGAVRVVERVVAEDLGQDYVRETRSELLASALAPSRGVSLGTTVARTTNDLTAVKNWVSLGIAPVVVGVPLVVTVVVALAVLTPVLAVVVVATVSAFGAAMVALGRPLYDRARRLRKVRGAMAAHIADTVTARDVIRVSGGIERELGRIDRLSGKVQDASRRRAVVSGTMRGVAASVTALLSVLVAVAGGAFDLPVADVTTGVLVAGMLASPLTDLGRVGEYRQNVLAAVAVLDPVLADARAYRRAEERRAEHRRRHRHRGDLPGPARAAVHVADLVDRHGSLPELVAAPGARVLVVGTDEERVARVLAELAGDVARTDGWVRVAGRHMGGQPARERRALVGVAARDVPIERGTIARAVRYRVPHSQAPAEDLLGRVGLGARVARLPDGERTMLRRGGDPLTASEQGLLKVARALADDPPLVVLDRVDDQLDAAGRDVLADVLTDYPGCLVLRSTSPEAVLEQYDVWNLDETAPRTVIARSVADVAAGRVLPGATAHRRGCGSPFGDPARRPVGDRTRGVGRDREVDDESEDEE